MKAKFKRKKKESPAKTISKLAPLFFSLAMTGIATSIAAKIIGDMFNAEERDKLWQLKRQGATEYTITDNKGKTKSVYVPIKELKERLERFIKGNPKYKRDKIELGKGYFKYSLRYQKRSYHRDDSEEEDEICSKCGHYLGDEYD